jgi:hypothetical protein
VADVTTLTKADLQQLGYTVVDGRAEKSATPPIGDEDATWQKVEANCRKVFEKAGCTVYSTSQRRRSRVSAGVPDLIVFGPPGAPFHLYFEVKAGRGKLSGAQRQFALHCQRSGIEFDCGGETAARQMLKHLLLSKRGAA